MSASNNRCSSLDRYLDGRLPQDALTRFEVHLRECAACRREVEEWHEVGKRYAAWSETLHPVASTEHGDADARSFVAGVVAKMERAPETTIESSAQISRKVYLAAAAAAVATLLAGTVYLSRHSPSGETGRTEPAPGHPGLASASRPDYSDADAPVATADETSAAAGARGGRVLSAPQDRSVTESIGGDLIGIEAGSAVRVVETGPHRTALRMIRGTVGFEVEPRQSGERFIVTAGAITIEVVGTRFGVEMKDPDTVAIFVAEGTVAVSSSDNRTLVHAGSAVTASKKRIRSTTEMTADEKALLAALLPPMSERENARDTEAPGMRSVGKRAAADSAQKHTAMWRQLIVDGEVDKAEKHIRRYLRDNPGDMEAVLLLAVCQKKQGRYEDAAATYKRAAVSGEAKYANRARYLAAELLQSPIGNCREAVALLDAYLRNTAPGTPNRAEATLRKAECLITLGERSRAAAMLTQLIAENGRAPVANRARSLLQSTDLKRNPAQ